MRKIIFRGKPVIGRYNLQNYPDIESTKWVYGYLVKSRGGYYILQEYNEDGYDERWEVNSWVEVIPETVGQFIGVKGYEGHYASRHKNMVDLYEGDIVEATSEGSKGVFRIWYRVEGNPCWLLYPNWQSQKHWSISASNIGGHSGIKEDCIYDDLKRIGNIHDNPDLITN